MKKRLIYIIACVGIILLGTGIFFAAKKFFTPEKVHYHAGFVVFQNNHKLDFSDNIYMSVEPCTVNGKTHDSEADKQIEKAHLHDNVGDVVHIEQTGAIWKDLFTNIKFPLNYSKVNGYVNGKQVPDFQSQPIRPDDSLVIFIGNNDKKLLSQAVTKEYIQKQAKKSTTCGD
jgi:hypothetical protein